jgi:methylase of polypeptide subunit release factors
MPAGVGALCSVIRLGMNATNTPTSLITPSTPTSPHIDWHHKGLDHHALWRSERGALPPKRVVVADDTLNADTAYRLACEGTGLLWQGDFQNAKQLLQALARRLERPKPASKQALRLAKKVAKAEGNNTETLTPPAPAPALAIPLPSGQAFHLHRQAQAHRARVLGMVLLPLSADYSLDLRRAPDAKDACAQAYGIADADTPASVVSLREILGLIGAYEWRKAGVEIADLGHAPNNRIHPHYGVYSPVRGEYLALIAAALVPFRAAKGHGAGANPFSPQAQQAPQAGMTAFDVGTGTGVVAALLARGGIDSIVATDTDPRAIRCARANIKRLAVMEQVQIQTTDMFPEGLASLIVCNPPWLPARANAPIERAIYDEGSVMLLAYLNGLAAHLEPGGEGWLVMSDLAELLGLRTAAFLRQAIADAGLVVLGHTHARPLHRKAQDPNDALFAARSKERTTLWRLGVAPLH